MSFFFIFDTKKCPPAKTQWRAGEKVILFAPGAMLSFVLIQGVIDYIILGYPFAEFTEYVSYGA